MRPSIHHSAISTTRKILLGMMTLLLAVAITAPTPCRAGNLTGQLQYAEGTYRISVGDQLSINVYNQPDLSHDQILVRPDGNASFNGIGEIQVVGKTIREATLLLESQLRELLREPRITLTVSESKPPVLYLAGAVIRPGMLQLGNGIPPAGGLSSDRNDAAGSLAGTPPSGHMDFHLSSVLASAGGVKLNADLANVMITRDGLPYKTVNLWTMLKNGDKTGDVMLQNGDSVYIPELPEQALDDDTYRLLLASSIGPRVFPVRIIGEVKSPGIYELTAQSPYLNSALAKGGGFGPEANRKVVALRRFTAQDKFTTVFINPNRHDFMLRPNDVIYVSEMKTYRAGHFAENVSKVLMPFSNAASTAFGFALFGGL